MKAYIIEKNGGVENLVLSELPVPAIRENEVLVHTRAVSINRIDAFFRQNDFAVNVFYKPEDGERSIVPGWDLSGVVTEVGENVKGLKVGDPVFGLINFFGRGRTNAEYVAAPAEHLALKPSNISHQEAAAAGMTALTAWDAIMVYGQVLPGQKVLIHGAGGGVGHFAVQLAKTKGAYVVGTGSSDSRDFVLGIGADEFVDYTTGPVDKSVFDADVVVDPMPGEHIFQSLHAAKPRGRVISLLPYDDVDGRVAAIVTEKKLFTHRVVVKSDGSVMNEIATLLETGLLKSHVSKVFPFDQLPLAHLAIETGKTKGKIVVVGP